MKDLIFNLKTIFEGDFFIIFIAIIVVMIATIIVYIVKLTSKINKNNILENSDKEKIMQFDDVQKKEEDAPKNTKEKIKKEKEIDALFSPLKEEIKEEELKKTLASFEISQEKLIENIADEIKEEILEIKNETVKEEVGNVKKNIEQLRAFEDEEEASAIISSEELEKKTQELILNMNMEYMDPKHVISEYEEEQEKKAIISYEELLKNATNLSVSYKEESSNTIDAPIIKRVEVGPVHYDITRTYIDEESFLQSLKDFRVKLE